VVTAPAFYGSAFGHSKRLIRTVLVTSEVSRTGDPPYAWRLAAEERKTVDRGKGRQVQLACLAATYALLAAASPLSKRRSLRSKRLRAFACATDILLDGNGCLDVAADSTPSTDARHELHDPYRADGQVLLEARPCHPR